MYMGALSNAKRGPPELEKNLLIGFSSPNPTSYSLFLGYGPQTGSILLVPLVEKRRRLGAKSVRVSASLTRIHPLLWTSLRSSFCWRWL